MRIAWSELFCHPLPMGHRFPMKKYELIPELLVYQGIVNPSQFFCPQPISRENLLLTHDAEYVDDVLNLTLDPRAARKIGFPLSEILVERELVITQGSLDCAFFALEQGAAMNSAGGTHHAFANRGEGFCIFNDFAVAANCLLSQGIVKHILIVDLDVHQGNGTAALFANEKRVYTFSMHGQDNYPHHKEISDFDIPLSTGISGEEYLLILQSALLKIMSNIMPDLVFYVSGVDVLKGDKLGKLVLSKAECRARDKIIALFFAKKGIPLVVAMGGGYSSSIADIVDAHCATFEEVQAAYF